MKIDDWRKVESAMLLAETMIVEALKDGGLH
nr:MAG TPA: hypothetical protein [Caudoviricetes sp.]